MRAGVPLDLRLHAGHVDLDQTPCVRKIRHQRQGTKELRTMMPPHRLICQQGTSERANER